MKTSDMERFRDAIRLLDLASYIIAEANNQAASMLTNFKKDRNAICAKEILGYLCRDVREAVAHMRPLLDLICPGESFCMPSEPEINARFAMRKLCAGALEDMIAPTMRIIEQAHAKGA